MLSLVESVTRPFDFNRDTFAFANELMWLYHFDGQTGRVTTRKNHPPPTYAHRCFVVVRSARQFRFHAEFDPGAAPIPDLELAGKIREVVRRSDCLPSAENKRITFPGIESLRELSDRKADILKANCGGAWQSYINRRHWRMLLPFSRADQASEALRLKAEVRRGSLPIVHVLRFPRISINHAVLIFDAAESSTGIDFAIYDPNLPETPGKLVYSSADRTFQLPRNTYWRGGPVNVYETYRP